jgi:hypothetical protein
MGRELRRRKEGRLLGLRGERKERLMKRVVMTVEARGDENLLDMSSYINYAVRQSKFLFFLLYWVEQFRF